MSTLRWVRWRRYAGGPLQRWHLATGHGDTLQTLCGTQPGQYCRGRNAGCRRRARADGLCDVQGAPCRRDADGERMDMMSTQETREQFRERIYTEYHTRRGEALLRESKQKGVSLEYESSGETCDPSDEIRQFAAERGIELGEVSNE